MSASKAFSIGGVGSQPTLDDVVRVALGQAVALDPAGADRVKKASPPPKNFQPEEQGQIDASTAAQHATARPLSPEQSRAVLAVKLLQLMNGRSGVRLAVPDYLAAVLNQDTAAAFTLAGDGRTDASVMSQVVELCYGSASPLLSGLPEAPKLSAAERIVLTGGAAASAGISSLSVQAAKRLLSLGTAVAALSFEAVGAQIKCLDAELVESQGSNAAVACADELRGLMEASKRVGTLKAGANDALPAAFGNVAQRLGAVSESIAAAYALVRAEVQSEALPPKGASPGNTVSPRLPQVLCGLASSLLSLAADAQARAGAVAAVVTVPEVQAALGSVVSGLDATRAQAADSVSTATHAVLTASLQSPGSGGAGQNVPGVQAALAAQQALEVAVACLAVEALVATVHLRVLEGPPVVAAAAPEPTAAPAPAAADGGDKGGKKQGGGKDKKKGGPPGVVLGKGTTVLRTALEALTSSSTAVDAGSGAGVTAPPCVPTDPAAFAAVLSVLRAALSPLSATAGKVHEDVRGVVEANQARRKPKVPKGARDFLPLQMAIRERAFERITRVFKRHGAVSIDTPVFELRETLMGKYGEDSKLIYDLADQGGEILSLRYDLTVPFARYVAVNGITNIKRYHIGKVYRRDQPRMDKGRFREFFQCDFDVAGAYPVMVPDAEVLKVLTEILTDLELGAFEVKLNHRQVLDALMDIAGVPPQKFRAICSAIDKLDKEPWEVVRSEMVNDKGLPGAVADKIGEFVVLRGEPWKLLEVLSAANHPLMNHPASKQALEELRTLFTYLDAMGALSHIVLDLSLARGLDYYTGVIYEAVLQGASVGSIAAGGRYDTLVGMFSGRDVPAVGVSIGIERVFAIMEEQVKARAAASGQALRATDTQVLVCSIGNNMQAKRMEVASLLWSAGIRAEFGYKANPKMGDQLNYVFDEGIPFMVLFGDDELKAGKVKIKDVAVKQEDTVELASLVPELQARIATAATRPPPAAPAPTPDTPAAPADSA